MTRAYPIISSFFLITLLAPPLSAATFPGRPLLLSAEGMGQHAAWVVYENGDVLRCQAATASCVIMKDLPTFASPVSLSAEPGHAAAWVGWTDGMIYRCVAEGHCTAMTMPAEKRQDPKRR